MGTSIRAVAAVLSLLACTGCGTTFGPLKSNTPRPSPVEIPSGTTSSAVATQGDAPWIEPDAGLRAVAARFVTASLSYQAATEEQNSFITRLDWLATPDELTRLRSSERARLRWWVLRQRSESATVQITGISQRAGAAHPISLRVEAVRTTWSSVGRVRDFVDLKLVVVRTPGGWRVDRAVGGGL